MPIQSSLYSCNSSSFSFPFPSTASCSWQSQCAWRVASSDFGSALQMALRLANRPQKQPPAPHTPTQPTLMKLNQVEPRRTEKENQQTETKRVAEFMCGISCLCHKKLSSQNLLQASSTLQARPPASLPFPALSGGQQEF